MTVKELIIKLSAFDQESIVALNTEHHAYFPCKASLVKESATSPNLVIIEA